MTAKAGPLAMLLAACLLALGGCQKTVNLTITNHTEKAVKVEIDGPHEGDEDIGVVAPGGGRLRYDLKIPEGKLPATFEFDAGKHETKFTVNRETPDKLWVDITPEGIVGPRERPRRALD